MRLTVTTGVYDITVFASIGEVSHIRLTAVTGVYEILVENDLSGEESGRPGVSRNSSFPIRLYFKTLGQVWRGSPNKKEADRVLYSVVAKI